MKATSGSSWTDTAQGDEATLRPGESTDYQRVFMVGVRGDVASVIAELTHASGQPVGGLEIALVDEKGAPVKTPAGAKIVLSTPAGADVLSIRATNESDPIGGEGPPGQNKNAYAAGRGRKRAAPQVGTTPRSRKK